MTCTSCFLFEASKYSNNMRINASKQIIHIQNWYLGITFIFPFGENMQIIILAPLSTK